MNDLYKQVGTLDVSLSGSKKCGVDSFCSFAEQRSRAWSDIDGEHMVPLSCDCSTQRNTGLWFPEPFLSEGGLLLRGADG
ncbi:hypothetical protein MASR2M79_16930 [Aminivibrio sp.]